MQEEQAEAELPANLKGVYQRLHEILEVLSSPKNSLNEIVNG